MRSLPWWRSASPSSSACRAPARTAIPSPACPRPRLTIPSRSARPRPARTSRWSASPRKRRPTASCCTFCGRAVSARVCGSPSRRSRPTPAPSACSSRDARSRWAWPPPARSGSTTRRTRPRRAGADPRARSALVRRRARRMAAVQGLYALQNGYMGFERSGLFYGERSADRFQIPITYYIVRTSDAVVLFDTGVSPRAVPGLMRNDPLARFADEDLLIHRLDSVGLEPADVDLVVLSHLHYDHAGGAFLFQDSELAVQKDEYAYAHYPAAFFASFYYRKNFDLPDYRWRLLDGDTELVPGVTAVRSDGHTPGHQSLLVELPQSGPVK